MKSLAKPFSFKMLVALLLFNLMNLAVMAQDSGSSTTNSTTSTTTDVKISETSTEWYTSPWVWVIGAAVFILLLVALTRGGSSRRTVDGTTDRVTVTKTVERDTDTI